MLTVLWIYIVTAGDQGMMVLLLMVQETSQDWHYKVEQMKYVLDSDI